MIFHCTVLHSNTVLYSLNTGAYTDANSFAGLRLSRRISSSPPHLFEPRHTAFLHSGFSTGSPCSAIVPLIPSAVLLHPFYPPYHIVCTPPPSSALMYIFSALRYSQFAFIGIPHTALFLHCAISWSFLFQFSLRHPSSTPATVISLPLASLFRSSPLIRHMCRRLKICYHIFEQQTFFGRWRGTQSEVLWRSLVLVFEKDIIIY